MVLGVTRHPGHHQHPHHLPRKRGPAVVRPGFNIFQPGVFRVRPRVVMACPGSMPMFTPLTHHQDLMDLLWELFLEIDQDLLVLMAKNM